MCYVTNVESFINRLERKSGYEEGKRAKFEPMGKMDKKCEDTNDPLMDTIFPPQREHKEVRKKYATSDGNNNLALENETRHILRGTRLLFPCPLPRNKFTTFPLAYIYIYIYIYLFIYIYFTLPVSTLKTHVTNSPKL